MRSDFYLGTWENYYTGSKVLTALVAVCHETLPTIKTYVTKDDFHWDANSWKYMYVKTSSPTIHFGRIRSVDRIMTDTNVVCYNINVLIQDVIHGAEREIAAKVSSFVHKKADRREVMRPILYLIDKIRYKKCSAQAIDDLEVFANSAIADKAVFLFVIRKLAEKYGVKV